jgi:hypothetical protein
LVRAQKCDEILEVESKYRHIENFSNNPAEDAFVLHAFGSANYDCSTKDEICLDRAIHYYERAKERMEDVNAGDRRQTQMSFIKTEIGMNPVCIQRIVTWKKQYLCIDGYLQTAAVTKSQRSI